MRVCNDAKDSGLRPPWPRGWWHGGAEAEDEGAIRVVVRGGAGAVGARASLAVAAVSCSSRRRRRRSRWVRGGRDRGISLRRLERHGRTSADPCIARQRTASPIVRPGRERAPDRPSVRYCRSARVGSAPEGSGRRTRGSDGNRGRQARGGRHGRRRPSVPPGKRR